MTDAAGLITLRFDAEGDLAAWHGAGQRAHAAGRGGLVRARLYDVADATPARLVWYETAAPQADGQAWLAPGAAVERFEAMSFRLMRDVGDATRPDLPWLYVVHTDVPDDIVDEYNRWYDQEHLPRLVTVPGVIRARRYTALAGHPRYLTAYELTERDAFASPAGLKARKTPWTEKMRSLFSNTRRLMGRLVS